MAKIAIIGAGGFVFPLRLAGDILGHKALQSFTLSLMDIDPLGLERTIKSVRELIAHHGLPARVVVIRVEARFGSLTYRHAGHASPILELTIELN